MTNTAIEYSLSTAATTLAILRSSGIRQQEGIVLWLGRRTNGCIDITEVYEPSHIAEADFFRIPPLSMQTLKEHLRKTRLMVAAQVHSHPMHAFHSQADDRWAIVRHIGAVSIVLPYFAQRTSPERFLVNAATFQLNGQNQWVQVPHQSLNSVCRISP